MIAFFYTTTITFVQLRSLVVVVNLVDFMEYPSKVVHAVLGHISMQE